MFPLTVDLFRIWICILNAVNLPIQNSDLWLLYTCIWIYMQTYCNLLGIFCHVWLGGKVTDSPLYWNVFFTCGNWNNAWNCSLYTWMVVFSSTLHGFLRFWLLFYKFKDKFFYHLLSFEFATHKIHSFHVSDSFLMWRCLNAEILSNQNKLKEYRLPLNWFQTENHQDE